jgi:hypothetical protein
MLGHFSMAFVFAGTAKELIRKNGGLMPLNLARKNESLPK